MLNGAGVYLVRSLVNEKRYVGSTANFKKRWTAHRSQLRRQLHPNRFLQSVYNKHGLENLEFSVLEIVQAPSAEHLFEREQYWCEQLVPEMNLVPVAGSVLGMKHTPEAKAKISVASKLAAAKRINPCKVCGVFGLFTKGRCLKCRERFRHYGTDTPIRLKAPRGVSKVQTPSQSSHRVCSSCKLQPVSLKGLCRPCYDRQRRPPGSQGVRPRRTQAKLVAGSQPTQSVHPTHGQPEASET